MGRVDADDAVELVAESSIITRLGEGVDTTHQINSQAEDRAVEAISQFLWTARDLNSGAIRLVGTSAIRDAVNRDHLIGRLRREFGMELEVLSEDDECRFSFLAVALDQVLGTYTGSQIVADVGGGSTELAFGSGRNLEMGTSLKIGGVRLTERCLAADPPSAGDLASARAEADKLLLDWLPGRDSWRVVGVGGSAINLMRIQKRIPADTIQGVHGSAVSRGNIEELVETLACLTIGQRKKLVGLEPDRADTILAGAVIYERILAASGAGHMVVSTRGLRHGLLYDMLLT